MSAWQGTAGTQDREGSLSKRRRARDRSALIVGTSTEFLGKKPLPIVVRQRPVLLVLGEAGTGKTSVARRILGQNALRLRGEALQEACARAVRRGRWPEELLVAPGLILDGPTYLNRRPGVVRLLGSLLASRSSVGLRTVVCQGKADDTASLLMDGLETGQRATVTLRFPIGRGRVRFAVRMCQQLDLPTSIGRQLEVSEPWTYRKVIRALHVHRREDVELTSG